MIGRLASKEQLQDTDFVRVDFAVVAANAAFLIRYTISYTCVLNISTFAFRYFYAFVIRHSETVVSNEHFQSTYHGS